MYKTSPRTLVLRMNSYHAAEGVGDAEELAEMWILCPRYRQEKYL